ncbi:hypothetical protein P8452_14935 [Trifolium repens]|nr:hypothetical protein P8452_14935 [Trifolium repens]
MDIHPIKNQSHSNVPFPQVSIPDELIAEILLFLDVKTIVRFNLVPTLWNDMEEDEDDFEEEEGGKDEDEEENGEEGH